MMITTKNIRANLRTNIIGILTYCLIGILLSSCEENMTPALPADGNVSYVNFVNLGEIFLYGQNDTLIRDNRMYINDSINNAPFDKYNGRVNYPMVFTTELTRSIRQYPTSLTGVNTVIINSNPAVAWLAIDPGDYRFIFTSRDRTYLHTANETLRRQAYQMFYLVESPESESSYTVVNVPIERNDRLEGTLTVQFVHLSPDAGNVEVYRTDAAGNETHTLTQTPLAFGEHTTKVLPLNVEESRLSLRFRVPGGKDLLSFSLNANNGAVYTVLLRGFVNLTERKIKKNNEEMAAVEILPDLRADSRRVFY